MASAPALSTMVSASASILSRVVSTSGKNIDHKSAFHTHDHLSSASSGKSAFSVETPQ